ncbi:MAG: hypothetical protein HYV60_18205 [Planctomycetia bacterium]|nr:hypothetical protein [Planctomycetia bacterium]
MEYPNVMFNRNCFCVWILGFNFFSFPLLAADVIRPLHVVHVGGAQSQVNEGSTPDEASWVLVHHQGLTVVNVESGAVVDVLKVPKGEVWSGLTGVGTGRLTPDGKFFCQTSHDRRILTVGRVADGSTLAQMDSQELFKQLSWQPEHMLAADGTYCFALARQGQGFRIVRLDFSPAPRITASQDLGPLGHTLFATPHATGLVVVVPSDATERAPKARWLQVFDHQLRLQYKEKVTGPTVVLSAAALPNPLIALKHSGREDLYRGQSNSHWMVGELVRGTANSNEPFESSRTKLARREWIRAAAFSSDGKWLVTSRVGARPTLEIWSTGSGTLHREVYVEGGQYELPEHKVFVGLSLSKSDRYLCASDPSNAYLLDFANLVAEQASER